MKSDNDSVIEFEWIEVNIDDDCKAVQPKGGPRGWSGPA